MTEQSTKYRRSTKHRTKVLRLCECPNATQPSHRRRACRDCKAAYMRGYRAEGRYKVKEHARYDSIKGSAMMRAKTRVMIEVRAGRIPRPDTLQCVDCGRLGE